MPISSNDAYISKKTNVVGAVDINPQLLSQEHEYVTRTESMLFAYPPNGRLINLILGVIQKYDFQLQQITQAPPGVHPTGRLDAKIEYWDIVGRRYDPMTLDAIDLHLVVSGYEHVSGLGRGGSIKPSTQVDVRLRCLHDPRNNKTPELINLLLGSGFAKNTHNSAPSVAESLARNHAYQVLMECGPFDSQSELRAIFNDDRISHLLGLLPEANTPSERVDQTIEYTLRVYDKEDENGLIALVDVIHDRLPKSDRGRKKLSHLKQVLATALKDPTTFGDSETTTQKKEIEQGILEKIRTEVEKMFLTDPGSDFDESNEREMAA